MMSGWRGETHDESADPQNGELSVKYRLLVWRGVLDCHLGWGGELTQRSARKQP